MTAISQIQIAGRIECGIPGIGRVIGRQNEKRPSERYFSDGLFGFKQPVSD